MERVKKGCGGWEIKWSKNKVSVLFQSNWKYFNHQTETGLRRESLDIKAIEDVS